MRGSVVTSCVALVVCGVLLAGACGGDGDGTPVALTGTTWEWQETRGGDGSVTTPGDPGAYSLRLATGDRVQIGADCNRASGTYALSGNSLAIQVGPTTRAHCGADSLSTEYLRQLGAVTGQSLDDGDLSLVLGDEGGAMTFGAP